MTRHGLALKARTTRFVTQESNLDGSGAVAVAAVPSTLPWHRKTYFESVFVSPAGDRESRRDGAREREGERTRKRYRSWPSHLSLSLNINHDK